LELIAPGMTGMITGITAIQRYMIALEKVFLTIAGNEEFTEVVTLDRESLMETREKLKFLQDRDSFTIN
jgi:hypothetical protein